VSDNVSARNASRRAVVVGMAGMPLLAACGSDEEPSGSGGEGVASPDEPSPSGGGLTTKSDIPMGSGKIFPSEKVVVTQPAEGEFKAFSAVCTHQGCVVSSLEGKEINCKCHGSKFSIEDGSVINGPAKKALEERQVTAEGENLTVT
jgi:nitrite reductase/ring-hydroxylating ferredoxin subunit